MTYGMSELAHAELSDAALADVHGGRGRYRRGNDNRNFGLIGVPISGSGNVIIVGSGNVVAGRDVVTSR